MAQPQQIRRIPNSFSYSLHFPAVKEVQKIKGAYCHLSRGKIVFDKDPVITQKQIRSLRQQLNVLVSEAREADHVATFALGGVAPLLYITRCLLTGDDMYAPVPDRRLRQKFHLFSGLNWRGNNRYDVKKRFLSWLHSLPENTSLLIFDTGNEGNGTNQAYNLVEKYLKGKHPHKFRAVQVVGIVTLPDHLKQRPADKKIGINRVRLCRRYLHVDAVPFEDASQFAGYCSISSVGLIQPLKSHHSLFVIDDTGAETVIASADVSGAFQALLHADTLVDKVVTGSELPDYVEEIDLADDFY